MRANIELFLEVKYTKREQRAIETLINNDMAKERAFYCSNGQFVSNITGDIIFPMRSPNALEINISQVTC